MASGRCARMPVHVDGVVAEDDGIGPELAQLLDQVVDEGVVVVDDQDPGSHERGSVPSLKGATGPRLSYPRALCQTRRSQDPGRRRTRGSRPGGAPRPRSADPRRREESGRYTPPIPKSVRRSPPWYGVLVLALLIGGVAVIVVNYLAHLPFASHGSPWGLVVGLAMIFAGFLMATRYR